MNRPATLMILVALMATGACRQQQSDLAPTAATLDSSSGYAAEQRQYLASLRADQGWQSTPSGLRYRRVGGNGQGRKPSPTDTVTLHYAGTLTNGTSFDSSIERGEPVTMALPTLIRGWQEGVLLMSVGDRYEFAMPAELGYGDQEAGPIPAGSTLLFTIDLLGIGGASG